MLVTVSAHQIPLRPKEVAPRIIARGIRRAVNTILIVLHSFVLPKPEMAPIAISSTHINGSLNPTIIK